MEDMQLFLGLVMVTFNLNSSQELTTKMTFHPHYWIILQWPSDCLPRLVLINQIHRCLSFSQHYFLQTWVICFCYFLLHLHCRSIVRLIIPQLWWCINTILLAFFSRYDRIYLPNNSRYCMMLFSVLIPNMCHVSA